MSTSSVRIAFIGAGAMGGAIARGLVASGRADASRIAVADPSEAIRASFSELGCAAFDDASAMLAAFDADVAVIAVKPQVLEAVVTPLAVALSGRLVVSIAAGVRTSAIEALLASSRVVRVMPNLPMSAMSGAAAICAGASAGPEDLELVRSLLEPLGAARIMREDQLDVAGVVSGSGPAFFALLVDELTQAAVKAGLPAADGRAMVEATMLGTARMLIDGDIAPRELMERVSSPGGTTIAALRVLEPQLIKAVDGAVEAALARTAELAAAKKEER